MHENVRRFEGTRVRGHGIPWMAVLILFDEAPSRARSTGSGRQIPAHVELTDPVVIVFGAHITALSVIRSFGRRRVPVFVAGGNNTTIRRSRWYLPVPGADVDESAGPERIAAFLRALPFPRSVLFPCSDRWTIALASLPDDVTAVHVPVAAQPDVVRILIDKQLFAQAAATHDVPAPRVLAPDQLDTIRDDELQHFFIKPRNSQQFSDRYGVKALQLYGRTHAADLLRETTAARMDVLLQEFIPGPATAHIFLDGYVDRSGTMRACLARRRLRMYPRDFGNSTLSITIPRADVAPAAESLQRLFRGLGYVGLFDAEFKLDARDGQFKIQVLHRRRSDDQEHGHHGSRFL